MPATWFTALRGWIFLLFRFISLYSPIEIRMTHCTLSVRPSLRPEWAFQWRKSPNLVDIFSLQCDLGSNCRFQGQSLRLRDLTCLIHKSYNWRTNNPRHSLRFLWKCCHAIFQMSRNCTVIKLQLEMVTFSSALPHKAARRASTVVLGFHYETQHTSIQIQPQPTLTRTRPHTKFRQKRAIRGRV